MIAKLTFGVGFLVGQFEGGEVGRLVGPAVGLLVIGASHSV